MTFKELTAKTLQRPLSSSVLVDEISTRHEQSLPLLNWLGNQSPMMIAWFIVMAINLALIIFLI